jgi:hypothetical protein
MEPSDAHIIALEKSLLLGSTTGESNCSIESSSGKVALFPSYTFSLIYPSSFFLYRKIIQNYSMCELCTLILLCSDDYSHHPTVD